MTNSVPGTVTNVQDQNQPMESVAAAQVPANINVDAPASTLLEPPMSTNDSLKNLPVTLYQGYQEWSQALFTGELGTVSNSIKTGIEELVVPFFGQKTIIGNVTPANVESLLDNYLYDSNTATPSKANATAKAAYDAGLQLFDYFITKEYIKDNPFKVIVIDDILGNENAFYAEEDYDDDSEGVYTNEDMQKFLAACLNSTPKYSAAKAVIFIYLVYAYSVPTSAVLQITWQDIDNLKANGKLDNFISRLLDNYRTAQKRWLKQKRIRNTEGYLFVKKGEASSEGIPCDSGFVSTWIKTHITNRRNMPYITLSILNSDMVPIQPLQALDKNANYPILGKIYIDGDYYRRGPSFDASTFCARWTGPEVTFRPQHRPKAGTGNRF